MKPVRDQLLIKVEEITREEVTKGGLYLPETAREEKISNKAEVIAISREVEEKNEVKVGDTIIFSPHAGEPVGGFKIISYGSVFGVIDG